MRRRLRQRRPTRAIPRSREADADAWPSFNRPLLARSAAVTAPRRCRPTPANSFMTAAIAATCCDRSRAIVACSAPTAMCRARRSRKRAQAVTPHHAVVGLVPPDSGGVCSRPSAGDWAGGWRSLTMLWGAPAGAMLIAAFVEPGPRAIIWTTMLLWMGGACLANARRCGRTHCRFTGPFFILMAAGVVAYAGGFLDLGSHGWSLLGGITLVGALGLWWASERAWGRFSG